MTAMRKWTDRDHEQVIQMVTLGKPQSEIAKKLKTSVASLNRHFKKYLNRKSGTEPKEFTEGERAQAIALASYGTPQTEIADMLGVCRGTLLKHLGADLRSAPTKANAAVARSLYRKAAIDGDVAAQKYWLKNRAEGWEDRVSIDGELGVSGTVRHEHSDVLNIARELSPRGRDALRIVLEELQEARSASNAIEIGPGTQAA